MTNALPEPRFLPSEHIEREVEYHLLHAHLMPVEAGPVDVEAFLETYLQVHLDQFAELDPDILGVTTVAPGYPPQVLINRDLTMAADDDTSASGVKGRWRATLAHEAGHVIFHRADLEAAAHQLTLFGPSSDAALTTSPLPCLKRDFGRTKGVNRREYQANLAMGALLMPRAVFAPTARSLINAFAPPFTAQHLSVVVQRLAARFEVSQTAARIRLEHLKLDGLGERTDMLL
jgi:hypothetical protein